MEHENQYGKFSLILGGCATLFVELALIHYIPGQIRVLGYFTNFVLLAALFYFLVFAADFKDRNIA